MMDVEPYRSESEANYEEDEEDEVLCDFLLVLALYRLSRFVLPAM